MAVTGRIRVAAAAGITAVAAVVLIAPAGAVAKERSIDLEIRSGSQQRILDRDAVRVQLRATRGERVRVVGFDRRPGAERRQATRPRNARGQGRRTVVDLALRGKGRERIARCAKRRIVVTARIRVRGGRDARARVGVPLIRDSERCDGGGSAAASARQFSLGGQATARRVNGTQRDIEARGLGEAPVRFAMFSCDSVEERGGELVFDAREDGTARPGPAGVGFVEPNASDEGEATPPVRTTEERAPRDGALTVTVDGRDNCGAAVVFADENGNGGLDVDADGVPTEPYGGVARTAFEELGDEVHLESASRCDFLDPAICLQPFPNDSFTRADSSTDTGLRLDLGRRAMPRNRLGMPIAPRPINRSDGFSPGSLITVRVPGLDNPAAFAETAAVPVDDLSQFERDDQPVLVIDAESGERHPIFAEIDANPANPADVNLLIRPAVNLDHGKRYIVALRDLRAADGRRLPAPRGFELYRDRVITTEPAVEARRERFERLLGELEGAGVERSPELYMAWDFTVASSRGIAGPMLSIRDRAFAELGDTDLSDMQVEGRSPTFLVTDVREFDPCGPEGCEGGLPFEIPDIPVLDHYLGPLVGGLNTALGELFGQRPQSNQLARRVKGYVVVPCYLNLPLCPPGSKFSLDKSGEPRRLPGNVTLAPFTCNVPRSAVDGGANPARPSLYGHGLLGSGGEVGAGNVQAMGAEHNMMFCATDWSGFATRDLPAILLAIQDLSAFTVIPDGSQQGFLNQLFLGRAMIHPEGFASHDAFRVDGETVIDTERLYYDGNSQGGILGGALTAVAPDFDRAVLGVPGMNYSTLLRRSVDFDPYASGEFLEGLDTPFGLYDSYPSELERPLILSLMQIMWDRSEANGYAHHMSSDPLPNTPPHEVLLQVAFGDHQVTQISADVKARTIGAWTNETPLYEGRSFELEPLWRIPRIADYPFDGSAIIYFDSGPPRPGDTGVVTPPTENVPPRPPEYGRDPHGDPRADPQAQIQKSEFLRPGGRVVDVCDGGPCYARGFTGP